MHVKAAVVFQGATNIPEDRFVNTYHFNSQAASLPAAALIIGPALASVYGTVANPNADGMYQYLSQFILRPFTIRFYDMAQAEPRVPYIQNHTLSPYTTGTPANIADLPEEVAVCSSFTAGPPITARRRGRIYLGPLNNRAMTDATAVLPARVDQAMRDDVVTCFQALAGGTSGWSVFSPTTGNLMPVVSGWVDNAFDTQRRRGPDASARSVWALP